MIGVDTGPDWMREVVQRFTRHWGLKVVAITVAITVFMTGYFILLRHPLFPVTLIPLTWADRLIGFEPWSLVPYVSLWMYISCAPMLLRGRRQYRIYISSVVLLAAVGFTFF